MEFVFGDKFFSNPFSCNVCYQPKKESIPTNGDESQHEISFDSTLEEDSEGKFTFLTHHYNDEIPGLIMDDFEKNSYEEGCNSYFDEVGIFHHYDKKWKFTLTNDQYIYLIKNDIQQNNIKNFDNNIIPIICKYLGY